MNKKKKPKVRSEKVAHFNNNKPKVPCEMAGHFEPSPKINGKVPCKKTGYFDDDDRRQSKIVSLVSRVLYYFQDLDKEMANSTLRFMRVLLNLPETDMMIYYCLLKLEPCYCYELEQITGKTKQNIYWMLQSALRKGRVLSVNPDENDEKIKIKERIRFPSDRREFRTGNHHKTTRKYIKINPILKPIFENVINLNALDPSFLAKVDERHRILTQTIAQVRTRQRQEKKEHEMAERKAKRQETLDEEFKPIKARIEEKIAKDKPTCRQAINIVMVEWEKLPEQRENLKQLLESFRSRRDNEERWENVIHAYRVRYGYEKEES